MNPFKTVLDRIEDFLETQAVKYRDAYLAQVKDLSDAERKTGHRGMFLP